MDGLTVRVPVISRQAVRGTVSLNRFRVRLRYASGADTIDLIDRELKNIA